MPIPPELSASFINHTQQTLPDHPSGFIALTHKAPKNHHSTTSYTHRVSHCPPLRPPLIPKQPHITLSRKEESSTQPIIIHYSPRHPSSPRTTHNPEDRHSSTRPTKPTDKKTRQGERKKKRTARTVANPSIRLKRFLLANFYPSPFQSHIPNAKASNKCPLQSSPLIKKPAMSKKKGLLSKAYT
ncbi:hypothetical protein BS50DRAFT_114121 [Corynespora cassiicola Philippines]|uniref:Uncharacterized protein n=1 Tax=Corynespora cassiicola Philippines TaxID=1448308 RepID=A0A2T2NDF8_CORCC|nr:hypothetical protein BS50DRAFT_114121 [Corynespora cassiicola Philippines]